jgi:hypothetical protein
LDKRETPKYDHFMNAGKWRDIPGVDISIPGRGEVIVYRENGREYNFDIFCGGHPLLLFVENYWDGVLPVTEKYLTEEERSRIIPRLVAYMGCKGEPVEIREKAPPAAEPPLSGRDVWEYRRRVGISE